LAEQILIRCHPDLRRRILEDAGAVEPRLTLSEVVVRILAKHYKDDNLAIIPRKTMGRPPKQRANVA
jgi:hypothetical protein